MLIIRALHELDGGLIGLVLMFSHTLETVSKDVVLLLEVLHLRLERTHGLSYGLALAKLLSRVVELGSRVV